MAPRRGQHLLGDSFSSKNLSHSGIYQKAFAVKGEARPGLVGAPMSYRLDELPAVFDLQRQPGLHKLFSPGVGVGAK